MSRIARSLRLGILLVALAAPLASFAADAGGWSYDLWNSLMSPFCPGRTLLDCTSPQAAELRDWIAAQEKAGVSREEVEQTLYREFGDVILQAPKASGFGIAAYVIPALGVLAGGVLVAIFLGRQGGGPPSSPPPVSLADPEIEKQIDEEMRRGTDDDEDLHAPR